MAEHGGRAAAGVQEAGEHLERGGLARAVAQSLPLLLNKAWPSLGQVWKIGGGSLKIISTVTRILGAIFATLGFFVKGAFGLIRFFTKRKKVPTDEKGKFFAKK